VVVVVVVVVVVALELVLLTVRWKSVLSTPPTHLDLE
jgi:hypothetical protein